MMKDKNLIAEPGQKIKLEGYATDYTAGITDKITADTLLAQQIQQLSDIQERLYADHRFAVLIIFQGVDGAGKDSTIKHVLSGVNPQGCTVNSFKQPTPEELAHDYLWRCYKVLPGRGEIGIFNRSYYEDVLVTRVHPELILKQALPNVKTFDDIDNDFFNMRYREICDMERHLTENGTIIFKFYLHLSKKEQKKRFLSRIDTESKNWKFTLNDIEERQYWDDYLRAFEKAINATSSDYAPWYIIPADNKWFMRLAVSKIITEKLVSLDLKFPEISPDMRQELLKAKAVLQSEE